VALPRKGGGTIRESLLIEAAWSKKGKLVEIAGRRPSMALSDKADALPMASWERKIIILSGRLVEAPIDSLIEVELPPPDHPCTMPAQEFLSWADAKEAK
jgi:hypothetical protein